MRGEAPRRPSQRSAAPTADAAIGPPLREHGSCRKVSAPLEDRRPARSLGEAPRTPRARDQTGAAASRRRPPAQPAHLDHPPPSVQAAGEQRSRQGFEVGGTREPDRPLEYAGGPSRSGGASLPRLEANAICARRDPPGRDRCRRGAGLAPASEVERAVERARSYLVRAAARARCRRDGLREVAAPRSAAAARPLRASARRPHVGSWRRPRRQCRQRPRPDARRADRVHQGVGRLRRRPGVTGAPSKRETRLVDRRAHERWRAHLAVDPSSSADAVVDPLPAP